MSLAIQTNDVVGVLLADGWHEVKRGSFDLDAYEFEKDQVEVHGGGKSGVCATGFTFRDLDDGCFMGPLTSVLSVRIALHSEESSS